MLRLRGALKQQSMNKNLIAESLKLLKFGKRAGGKTRYAFLPWTEKRLTRATPCPAPVAPTASAVWRTPSENDSRVSLVTLTKEGHAVVEELMEAIARSIDEKLGLSRWKTGERSKTCWIRLLGARPPITNSDGNSKTDFVPDPIHPSKPVQIRRCNGLNGVHR